MMKRINDSLLSTFVNDIGQSLDDLAHVNKVQLFIWSVDVGLRAAAPKSDDLCLGVLAFKFLQEWD